MNFVVKAQKVDPHKLLTISQEVIANQRVGSRLEFVSPHDITVEFANGMLQVDDVDLIIYVLPEEFFCYRGDEMLVKFSMATRDVEIMLEPPVRNINARAVIRVAMGEDWIAAVFSGYINDGKCRNLWHL